MLAAVGAIDETATPMRNQTLNQFFKNGKEKDIKENLNTGVQHLELLKTAADDLQNGPVNLSNKFKNAWVSQFGGTAPTNFDSLADMVSGEIVKAITGATGALGDREVVRNKLNTARSEGQLAGIIQQYIDSSRARANSLEQTYEQGTKLKDFKTRILLPEVAKTLYGDDKTDTGAAAGGDTGGVVKAEDYFKD